MNSMSGGFVRNAVLPEKEWSRGYACDEGVRSGTLQVRVKHKVTGISASSQLSHQAQ